jgi:hypothetical protein
MTDQIDAPVDPIVAQALNGVPQFYDLPDELRQTIEQATMTAERMFWLRANLIEKGPVTEALLRRALYAEARCWEMENRVAEVSLIASGMKERIEQLESEIAIVAGHTG